MNQSSILLMSSSRLHGHKFLEHAKDQIVDFLGRKNVKTILFVPYAGKDHAKYTDLIQSTMTPWGFQVEGIHAKSNPVEAVRKAEAIFVGGGNTFVLLNALYEKNLVNVIREQVLQHGIPYIGSSAGTNVATRSIHTTNDMPVKYPPTFDGLGLVPFNINPHYIEADENTIHKGETRDERLNEFMEYHKVPVLGLREGTSVLIEGGKATLIGNRPARLFRPDQSAIEVEPNADLNLLFKDATRQACRN